MAHPNYRRRRQNWTGADGANPPPRPPAFYRWQGIDPNGVAHSHISRYLNPPLFVRWRFLDGWRSLVVEQGGVKVGQIGTRDGERYWWAYERRDNGSYHLQVQVGEVVPEQE